MATRMTPAAERRQWMAQDDLRTLTAAAAIQADKGRMSGVKAHAKAQMATLTSVAGAAKKPAKK